MHWDASKEHRILNTETVNICNVVHINGREKSRNMEKLDISECRPTEKNEAQKMETVHLSMTHGTYLQNLKNQKGLQSQVSDNQPDQTSEYQQEDFLI